MKELSTIEAARALAVSDRTIKAWIAQGRLQSRKVGGRRLVQVPEPGEPGFIRPAAAAEKPVPGLARRADLEAMQRLVEQLTALNGAALQREEAERRAAEAREVRADERLRQVEARAVAAEERAAAAQVAASRSRGVVWLAILAGVLACAAVAHVYQGRLDKAMIYTAPPRIERQEPKQEPLPTDEAGELGLPAAPSGNAEAVPVPAGNAL